MLEQRIFISFCTDIGECKMRKGCIDLDVKEFVPTHFLDIEAT